MNFFSRTSLIARHLPNSRTFTTNVMSTEKATFAAGCFWGVEHIFQKYFKQHDIKTKVGYIGGKNDDPDYRSICSGKTNHAEALEIVFDPSKVSYETLVDFFYSTHDPTTLNYQGPDHGTQYRSAIFYHSPEQKTTAERVTAEIQEKYLKDKKIVTEIAPATIFYDAEKIHQNYLNNNPSGYQCPTHFKRW
ncbi:hypothetical protein BDF21DRAFT_418233 [Thamnidium elegans]|nr:hypothetical protein BDF21DRAFT_418233 [Thamnidium elegans]